MDVVDVKWYLREYRQKIFVTLSGVWPLMECGAGDLSESVKTGKFVAKIFFPDIVE